MASRAMPGVLGHLPRFRFERGMDRTDPFEGVHFRIFFRRERAGTGLGRKLVHPGKLLLPEGKPEDRVSRARRQIVIGVQDTQPDFRFSFWWKCCRFHGGILPENGAIIQADGEQWI